MSPKGAATTDVQRVRDVVPRALTYRLVIRRSRMSLGRTIPPLVCVGESVRTRGVARQFRRQLDFREEHR